MISRLDRLQGRDIYENTALAKLNEVIDAVNELQESLQGVVNNSIKDGARIQNLQEQIDEHDKEIDDCAADIYAIEKRFKLSRAENVPNIDVNELAFLSKENSDLKDELERITDILYKSKYALEEVINPSFISHEQEMAQEALDKVNAEIKAITGGE